MNARRPAGTSDELQDPRHAEAASGEMVYRMPAEWDPHEATWLIWPHNQATWPELLIAVEDCYIQIIDALVQQEHVHVLTRDAQLHTRVSRKLRHLAGEQLSIHVLPTDDSWARDMLPTFVLDTAQGKPSLAAVSWEFNAWGGKYPPWDRDNAAGQAVAALLGIDHVRPGVVMEGGGFDVNGQGLCITTASCLLNPNRNPRMARERMASVLHDFLGVRDVIWLARGITGDDTDGHVDDIARFVNENTVVAAVSDNTASADYRPLQKNLEILSSHHALEIIPLPMPEAVHFRGRQLPASYVNFYIANNTVLVPCFGTPRDARALGILGDVFPDRKIIGIACKALIVGLGAIHCISQQQPQVRHGEMD